MGMKDLLLLLGFSAFMAACGTNVRIIECPKGTLPEGSQCVPISGGSPGDGSGEGPGSDDDVRGRDSWYGSDEEDSSGGEDSDSDASEGEGPNENEGVNLPTGSQCSKNASCRGETCLDWGDGYCTSLDCTEGSCEGDDVCLPLLGNRICLASCEHAPCPQASQACKRLQMDSEVAVCVHVNEDAKGVGHTCQEPSDCLAEQSCLSSFPGGYCASLGCPDKPCSEDAVCVEIDGVSACLKACENDNDCGSTVGGERRCGVLEGIDRLPVSACISGVEGRGIGESCQSDFECHSGTCQLLGTGRCSQSAKPCFSNNDCNGAEYCNDLSSSMRVGVCAEPCGSYFFCPGGSFCVEEKEGEGGSWCRNSCANGADNDCETASGLHCEFGYPISDAGQPTYACTYSALPTALSICKTEVDCGGRPCIHPEGGDGYCETPCGDSLFCAFGSSCDFNGEEPRCVKNCRQNQDCLGGFECSYLDGATLESCNLKP